MPSGLEVYDASSHTVFGTATRLSRILGSANIGATASGYITNADFATGTIWWTITSPSSVLGSYCPTITIDAANNRIGYAPKTDSSLAPDAVTILYGVY